MSGQDIVNIMANPYLDPSTKFTSLKEILEVDSSGVNEFSVDGYFPLLVAVSLGDIDLVELILGFGASVQQSVKEDIFQDYPCPTAVHQVCQDGRLDLLELLLGSDSSLDYEQKNYKGQTPFLLAVSSGDPLLVSFLKNQSSLKSSDNYGRNALHTAINDLPDDEYLIEMVNVLLEIDQGYLYQRDCNGHTPTKMAALQRHPRAVQHFIDRSPEVNRLGLSGYEIAVITGNMDLLKILLESGVAVSSEDSALVLACKYSANDFLECLLTNRSFADRVNATDFQGFSPLYHTCINNNNHGAWLLFQHKASTHLDKVSPLRTAVPRGMVSLVVQLLQHHADLYLKQEELDSYMVCAVFVQNYPMIKVLLAGGVCVPNSRQIHSLLAEDYRGHIPHASRDMVQFLCSCGLKREISESLRQGDHSPEWNQILALTLSNPGTLKQSCRITIRNSIGRGLYAKIPSLPLPSILHSYLLFNCDDTAFSNND